MGGKQDRIINCGKSKTAEIETAEIEECQYQTLTELRKDDWNRQLWLNILKLIIYALKIEMQLCKKRLVLIVKHKEKEKFLLLLGQNYFAK